MLSSCWIIPSLGQGRAEQSVVETLSCSFSEILPMMWVASPFDKVCPEKEIKHTQSLPPMTQLYQSMFLVTGRMCPFGQTANDQCQHHARLRWCKIHFQPSELLWDFWGPNNEPYCFYRGALSAADHKPVLTCGIVICTLSSERASENIEEPSGNRAALMRRLKPV